MSWGCLSQYKAIIKIREDCRKIALCYFLSPLNFTRWSRKGLSTDYQSLSYTQKIITIATHRINNIRNKVGYSYFESTLDISVDACGSSADLISRGNCAKFDNPQNVNFVLAFKQLFDAVADLEFGLGLVSECSPCEKNAPPSASIASTMDIAVLLLWNSR